MTTGLLERTTAPVLDRTTGPGVMSHIIAPHDETKTAQAVVTEARIYGLEVEALCGHRWVPERDPRNYPICQACKELFEARFEPGSSDDLSD